MTTDRNARPHLSFLDRLISTWLGIVGVVLFVTSIVSFLFLLLMELGGGETSPYVGLFHYLVLPTIGTIGLVLAGAGLRLDRRREQRGIRRRESKLSIDIRQTPVRQRVLVMMGLVSGGLVFVMALGGERAFQYTESTDFCGAVCHVAMEPEFVAHQRSPHAQISCTDCHIGTGLNHFIAAKVRGIHQVIAVLTDDYERPIATPLADLRGSAEICENCHWAARDVGQTHRGYTYYSSEGLEEPWVLDILLDVGGVDPASGEVRGIHWHMNEPNRVDYIAADERRQEIPWVRVRDANGATTIYRNVDEPPDAELEAGGEIRTMECLDCHNRPAHQFASPIRLVNRAIASGVIDVSLPEIKFTALEALAPEYETREAAREAVHQSIEQFYADVYPEVLEEDRDSLDAAIAVLQGFYGDQFFPEMRTRWTVNPDNIGHWTVPGCFRCHDGLHRSDDGRVISADCATCHTVVRQGMRSDLQPGGVGVALLHPWDAEIMEAPIRCAECHDGVLGLGR